MASTDTTSHVLTVTKLEFTETNMGGENLAKFLTDASDKLEWNPLPDEKNWPIQIGPKPCVLALTPFICILMTLQSVA